MENPRFKKITLDFETYTEERREEFEKGRDLGAQKLLDGLTFIIWAWKDKQIAIEEKQFLLSDFLEGIPLRYRAMVRSIIFNAKKLTTITPNTQETETKENEQ